MNNNKAYRNRSFLILGAAILAAAWLIGGPDVLNKLNWNSKIIDLLIWMPVMAVYFWSFSGNKKFLACERRSFKKLLNLR